MQVSSHLSLVPYFIALAPAQAIVNLAEQQGKEGPITQAYRQYAEELASKDVLYVFVNPLS